MLSQACKLTVLKAGGDWDIARGQRSGRRLLRHARDRRFSRSTSAHAAHCIVSERKNRHPDESSYGFPGNGRLRRQVSAMRSRSISRIHEGASASTRPIPGRSTARRRWRLRRACARSVFKKATSSRSIRKPGPNSIWPTSASWPSGSIAAALYTQLPGGGSAPHHPVLPRARRCLWRIRRLCGRSGARTCAISSC